MYMLAFCSFETHVRSEYVYKLCAEMCWNPNYEMTVKEFSDGDISNMYKKDKRCFLKRGV